MGGSLVSGFPILGLSSMVITLQLCVMNQRFLKVFIV